MTGYVTKDAYDTYIYYLALKKHFTSDYDFFKYGGKIKASQMAFENRKDKFYFYKLSKMKEGRDLILSNVVLNPDIWAGDLLSDKSKEIYKSWIKRKQSLTYQFKSDIKELNDDFDSNFVVESGQHPRLLRLYMMNHICLETLVILTDLTKCLPYWNKKISDTIVYGDINRTVVKYRPFLDYDKVKTKKILLDFFGQTA